MTDIKWLKFSSESLLKTIKVSRLRTTAKQKRKTKNLQNIQLNHSGPKKIFQILIIHFICCKCKCKIIAHFSDSEKLRIAFLFLGNYYTKKKKEEILGRKKS